MVVARCSCKANVPSQGLHASDCVQITAFNDRAEQPAAGGFNLWGIANAVAETVKKGTAELATTVRETDWREEIRAFGRDVVEETEELGQSAISVVEHAVEHVEHLPQHVSTHEGPLKAHLVLISRLPSMSVPSAATISACSFCPVQAQTALPVMEERRRQVQQQLGQYGSHIGRFGREFVANTTELFEQVNALATVSLESTNASPHHSPGGFE